jgi:hypothetical protein
MACERLERHRLWVQLAIAYLGLLSLALLLRSRRTLWPPPLEVYYYAPVATFLVGLSLWVKGGMFVAPLSLLAGLGAGLNWLAAAAARRASQRRPARRWRRALYLGVGLAWRLLAVIALCYVVVKTQGLWELLIETLRNGADE